MEGDLTILRLRESTLTALTDIFPSLDSIRGKLTFNVNNQLTTASGFAELDSVGGDLLIASNRSLTALPGFASLRIVGGVLNIQGNEVLTEISGFDALTSIGNRLQISGNFALTTVSGFSAIPSAIRISVFDNTLLSSCCGLIRFLNGTRVIGVLRNNHPDGGCNSATEIMNDATCPTIRTLRASPSSLTPTAAAGSVTFDVTADTPWAITKIAEDTWITTISPETGSANQTITITYEENTSIDTREAILTLAATETGATEMVEITLTQAGAARQLSADETSIDVDADDTSATFNVTANVPWRIAKRVADTFITTISPESGNNNQEITVSYEENTAITTRDAILTLEATDAGATESVTITINQAAAARTLTVDNATINVNADQTSATFNVTANVPWEITNSDTWVTSFLPETGSDNQEITITYQENTAITSRDAVFTLATTDAGATISVTITLTQAAAARTLSADKTNITVLDVAGSVTFNVIANVPWGITQASPASWISAISPETGSANQEITITYGQNTTVAIQGSHPYARCHRCRRDRNAGHYPYRRASQVPACCRRLLPSSPPLPRQEILPSRW